jgi:4-hydroxy-tetrahydrodipicolinate reductase
MKIALLGYGKMGQTIHQIINNQYLHTHEIVYCINSQNAASISAAQLATADVAIEFSTPEAAFANINRCFDVGIPVVCGTTAWLDRYHEVVERCYNERQAFFYASNFSIGVNIFFALNKVLAELMRGQHNYRVQIDETHHITKKDAPSGTAITLAKGILAAKPMLKTWINAATLEAHELPIISHREADVKGTHHISYNSTVDTIQISHTAHSRQGFAQGAILAAEWLLGKTGVFGMSDMVGQ